jgi:hypothetical protein
MLPLAGDDDEGCQWKFKPTRVGLRTRILRLRVAMDSILF